MRAISRELLSLYKSEENFERMKMNECGQETVMEVVLCCIMCAMLLGTLVDGVIKFSGL